jgi:AAA+ superfamily predicted ATPase
MTREESINYLKETAKKYQGRDINCDFLTTALEVIEDITGVVTRSAERALLKSRQHRSEDAVAELEWLLKKLNKGE